MWSDVVGFAIDLISKAKKFCSREKQGATIHVVIKDSPIFFSPYRPVTIGREGEIGQETIQERCLVEGPPNLTIFFGNETLCLASFIKNISNLEGCTIYVEGRDTTTMRHVVITGKPTAGLIDGYIRTLRLITDEGIELDVGGSNATKERIAAERVSLRGAPRTLCNDFADTYVPFLGERLSGLVTAEDSNNKYEFLRINSAAAIARRCPDEHAVRTLLPYLKKNLPKPQMETVVESFRSFENICRARADLSVELTKCLIEYLRTNIAHPKQLDTALVYAIEALGYVANCAESKHMTCEHLSSVLKSPHATSAHRDVVWASLVTLSRTLSPNLNIKAIESLGGTLSWHPFESILQSLVDDIIHEYANLSYGRPGAQSC